ncbi:hypothetical protein [Microbulbifer celer]|uniref:Glycoside-hydrolase family GH114 TIM-barrel domain-containing protein n=1 Tax=Microbulbifer celer TaxID=435905 RepID=A0ABW3U7L9_9GAMM|nr:hypothetical protein [Microbulbifer celer]UFN58700.1 hypothetical protein LPW13_06570 [Microbulbifer celer]
MKRLFTALLIPLVFGGCNFDEFPDFSTEGEFNYKREMRGLVESISSYASSLDSGFVVIAEDAPELITTTGRQSAQIDSDYVSALDGVAQTGLFYGQITVDQATSASERNRLQAYLDLAQGNGANILVTDFAFTEANIDNAYDLSDNAGYVGFVAEQKILDTIPDFPVPIYNGNRFDVDRLSQAQNFLNLTNTGGYSTRQDLVNDVRNTDYDLIVMDFFFDGVAYTADQINDLKFKDNGRRRLLIATMNVGYAEDNRYYWESFWPTNPPEWLRDRVAGTDNAYYVDYWRKGWKDILYGNDDSYLFRIIDAGFDGVYLKGVGVYDYFENLEPVNEESDSEG